MPFLLALTLAFCARPLFAAKNISGPEAVSLIDAIRICGAQPKKVVESVAYSISNVHCGATVSGGHSVFACDLRDDTSGRQLRNRTTSEALFRALEKAGVKVDVYRGGLLLKAAKVGCKSGSIHGMPPSCVVFE